MSPVEPRVSLSDCDWTADWAGLSSGRHGNRWRFDYRADVPIYGPRRPPALHRVSIKERFGSGAVTRVGPCNSLRRALTRGGVDPRRMLAFDATQSFSEKMEENTCWQVSNMKPADGRMMIKWDFKVKRLWIVELFKYSKLWFGWLTAAGNLSLCDLTLNPELILKVSCCCLFVSEDHSFLPFLDACVHIIWIFILFCGTLNRNVERKFVKEIKVLHFVWKMKPFQVGMMEGQYGFWVSESQIPNIVRRL